jgi:hypothetical protein
MLGGSLDGGWSQDQQPVPMFVERGVRRGQLLYVLRLDLLGPCQVEHVGGVVERHIGLQPLVTQPAALLVSCTEARPKGDTAERA